MSTAGVPRQVPKALSNLWKSGGMPHLEARWYVRRHLKVRSHVSLGGRVACPTRSSSGMSYLDVRWHALLRDQVARHTWKSGGMPYSKCHMVHPRSTFKQNAYYNYFMLESNNLDVYIELSMTSLLSSLKRYLQITKTANYLQLINIQKL